MSILGFCFLSIGLRLSLRYPLLMMATNDNGPVSQVEIFEKIPEECRSDTGITHLWTDCRDVGTSWRDMVESIYTKDFLSKVAITLMLGQYFDLMSYKLLRNT